MNKQALFIGGILLALVSIAISIYYFTPNHYHILASPANEAHTKHGLAFLGLAVIAILASLANRPKKEVSQPETK